MTRTAGLGGVALVTGASGFIGTRLVQRLASVGRRVRALDIVAPRSVLPGIEYCTADVRRALPLDLGRDVSVIYNLAAVHKTPGHPAQAYYDTNVNGATYVTALARGCGIAKIVFTSSISVYGPCEARVSEGTHPAPTSDYGKSKLMAEGIHRQWQARDDANRLVIVRPGVVFGPGEGGNFTRLARALRWGYFAYPGRRDTIKACGHVDELLGALDFALSRDEARILFNFAYPDEATLEQIVGAFGAVAGYGAARPSVPLALMMKMAGLFEALNGAGLRNPIHTDRILKLVQSTRVAPVWLTQQGYGFKTDLRRALQVWRDETGGAFV